MMNSEKILEDSFRKRMKNKDFNAFKRDYPTLLKVIEETTIRARIDALEEIGGLISDEILLLKRQIKELDK